VVDGVIGHELKRGRERRRRNDGDRLARHPLARAPRSRALDRRTPAAGRVR
jgi:hypothetical protein